MSYVGEFEKSLYLQINNRRDRAAQLDLRVRKLWDTDMVAYNDFVSVMTMTYGLLSVFNLSVYRQHDYHNLPTHNELFNQSMKFIDVVMDFVEKALELAEDGC